MNVGLDLGTHSLRSVWLNGDHLRSRRCRCAYLVLPDSGARRHVLSQAGIPFASCEAHLVLMDDAAVENWRLFQAPWVPLLPEGKVPREDPVCRQILAAQVERLLPTPPTTGALCCMVLPRGARPDTPAGEHGCEFLKRLVRLRGYEPLLLSPGMAVVLSELVDEGFTGIGLTFGAGSCEFSLAHCGVEIATASLPRGGDWIDAEFARRTQLYLWDSRGHRLLDVEQAAEARQGLTSLLEPRTAAEELLCGLYRELVGDLLKVACEAVKSSLRVPRTLPPVFVVCGGGIAQAEGFITLFEQELARQSWPLQIAGIRAGSSSPYAVARGCLIHASLEQHVMSPVERAA